MRGLSICLLLLGLAPALAAQSTGVIEGTVTHPDSAAAAGARVVLRGTDYRTTADSAGRFRFDSVEPGAHVLVASLEGQNPGVRPVRVAAGETVRTRIVLGGPVELRELTVSAARSRPYTTDSASAGAKIAVPLRDLPQTVTTVTEAVIRDRNLTSISKLSESVSGVAPLVGYDGYGLNEQGYIIRGFASSYTSNSLRDGFRDFAGVVPRDVVGIERVEFLKGPSSVLYGSTGALGGLPNTVTKRPSALRIAEVTMTGTQDGQGRATLDLGGPLSADSSLRFRLNAAGERSRNFRPFDGGAYGISVVPSIELVAGMRTHIRVSGEYTRRRYRPDPYLPLDPVSFTLPADRYFGEPATPLATAQGFTAQLVLEHRLSAGVHLRQGLSILGGRQRHRSAGIAGLDTLPDLVDRYSGYANEHSTDYASQSELTLEGRRFGVRHRALIGLELSREVYSILFTNDGLAPISLTRPVYGATDTPGDTVTASHPENQLGVYVQDLVDLGTHVKLMVGARFDANKTQQKAEWAALGLTGVIGTQKTSHLSPRAGVVYQPNATLSLYGGWSRSFFPNLSTPGLDPKFPPEYGEQFEGGIRHELAGGRFSWNAAAFQITKKNALEAIPNDSLGRSALSGEQRSRGIELDVQGSPLSGWNLVATYAYTDAKQTRSVDPSLPQGGRLSGVPRHAASLWTSYEIGAGTLRGLTLGAGVYAWTPHEASFPHTVEVPGWQRLDLLVAYDWRRYRVQLNLDNVSNTKYFLGNYAGLARQSPRTLSGSLSATL